jgi:hypothetical protein
MPQPLSTLLMVCPGRRPPDTREMLARFEGRATLVDPGQAEVPGTEMALPLRTPEGDEHLLQAFPADTPSLGVLLPFSTVPAEDHRAVLRARWVIASTTRLDEADPQAAFRRQMRFSAAAVPDAVAVHDMNAVRLLARKHLATVASWDASPPARELFQIHAVFPPDLARGWWFHTHGLERAGFPDVEVLGVPADRAEAAADLIHAFVRARLGLTVEGRGRAGEWFHGAPLAWIPVSEAVERLAPGEPGSLAERDGDDGHGGRRIALVAPGPRGGEGPPLEALDAFERGAASFLLPEREVLRAASLAAERWPYFARLFAAHGADARWRFVACLPASPDDPDSDRVWWTVHSLDGHRIEVRPEANAPSPEPPAWRWVEEVADWVVHSPRGELDPGTVRAA